MSPVLVFDSGLGGLSVVRALRSQIPGRSLIYVADNAGFPYGDMTDDALIERVVGLFAGLVAEFRPAVSVIACNTASTLVLSPLRERFAGPFVGTVPAVKPAASGTSTGLISVLATPGTVERDYTRDLIAEFARDVDVTLVGAPNLAALAESHLSGAPADRDAIAAEISPAFIERDGRRTDTVVLACTHYPLILDVLKAVAPWPVTFIDPSKAIARHAASILPRPNGPLPAEGVSKAFFTDMGPVTRNIGSLLEREGFEAVSPLDVPFDLFPADV